MRAKCRSHSIGWLISAAYRHGNTALWAASARQIATSIHCLQSPCQKQESSYCQEKYRIVVFFRGIASLLTESEIAIHVKLPKWHKNGALNGPIETSSKRLRILPNKSTFVDLFVIFVAAFDASSIEQRLFEEIVHHFVLRWRTIGTERRRIIMNGELVFGNRQFDVWIDTPA